MNYPEVFLQQAADLYGGNPTAKQAEGIKAIVDHANGISTANLAYALATAEHETRGFQTGDEDGQGQGRGYGRPGRNNGQIAYGRGYAQLTGDDNYEEFDRRLGLEDALVKNYELANDPNIAASILISGLTQGSFTGRLNKLPKDGPADEAQFREARGLVNGLTPDEVERAKAIAKRAIGFQDALTAAGYRGNQSDW